MAWKWTAPRFWYSATLAKEMRTPLAGQPRSRRRAGRAPDAGRWWSATTAARPGRSRGLERRSGSSGHTTVPPTGGRRRRGAASSQPACHADRSRPAGRDGRGTQPPLRLAGVDSAEGWGGEGHEQPRMGCHCLRDALAAPQTGGKELEAVGLVGCRTRGAHRHPSVAARLEQGGIRLSLGRVHGADRTRLGVGVRDPAAQPHRMGAVAGRRDLLGPPRIARPGPVHNFARTPGSNSPTRAGSVMLTHLARGWRWTKGWSPSRIGRVARR